MIIVLVFVTNLITAALLTGWHWYDETHSFEIAKWRAHSPGDCNDDYREVMVEDLAENYLRVGMARTDLLWMLGPPDFTLLAQHDGEQRPEWYYDTGTHGSDCEHLAVTLGREGRRVVGWNHRLLRD